MLVTRLRHYQSQATRRYQSRYGVYRGSLTNNPYLIFLLYLNHGGLGIDPSSKTMVQTQLSLPLPPVNGSLLHPTDLNA